MKLLSSDARKTTALAIPSGVPSLPSGTKVDSVFRRCSATPVDATRSFSPGVSMGPGLTAFTRMRRSLILPTGTPPRVEPLKTVQ